MENKKFKGTREQWHFVEYGGFINIQKGEAYADSNILDVELVGREVAEANARLIESSKDLLNICIDFVDKVERGEAKSTRTYNRMKEVVQKILGE